MRNINPFIIALFLLLSTNVFSQKDIDPKIDSLKKAADIFTDDSLKVLALNELSLNLWDANPDSAIYYASLSMKIGKEIDYKSGVAYAAKIIGMGYYSKGDYIKVFEYWQQSLDIFNAIAPRFCIDQRINIFDQIINIYH